MVSDLITLKIDNKEVNLNVQEIPSTSRVLKPIFKEFESQAPKELLFPTKNKINTLLKAKEALKNAQNSEIGDKLFGLIRCALALALLAAMVFSFKAKEPSSYHILGSVMGYCAISVYNSIRLGGLWDDGDNTITSLIVLVGGPFMPLYENFGKITRFERHVTKKKQEIETNLTLLTQAVRKDQGALAQTLSDQIKRTEQSLKILEQLPVKTAAGKYELEERVETLTQMHAAVTYYSKFI